MQRTIGRAPVLSLLSCLTLFGQVASAVDWPAYRGNSGRTATTSEQLTYPLQEVWKHVPKRKPLPAWPDRFMAEIAGYDYDYAPQVVIVGNTMLFGSTTDNTLWALDAATGKTKWGFTTGGPIRFAPAIWEGNAYVVSDDGYAYCLEAVTGILIWKFYGGLYDSRFIANGRMASRWLIRSGVVVDDGMVNFAVGMWPSEGVYVYALDAKTGKELWVNDTNLAFMPGPHGSDNFAGNMPQGYAAASKKQLVFSNGQSGCYIYDRRTGEASGHIDTRGEVRRAGRGDAAVVVIGEDGTISHGGAMATDAKIRQNWVVAGDTVIMCEENQITAKTGSPLDGEVVWEHTMDGTIMSVALGNGMLVVSTTDGIIHCFQSGQGGKAVAVGPGTKQWAKTAPGPAAEVLGKCKEHGISKGYALVLGEPDAKLAESLAANTELQVICALTDEAKVNAERVRLRETTDIYGVGVTVEYLESFEKLPFPPYFANVVVVNRLPAGLPMDEINRIQRPCGGIEIAGGKVEVRGKLPGAFDWDSQVSADQRVKWPLQMLWFGEPGPVNTIGKGIYPPTAVNGIALYVGRGVVAVDAYNGTVLWRWKPAAEQSIRYVTADATYVYCGGEVLDLKTGQPVEGVTSLGTRRGAGRSFEDRARYMGTRIHPLTGGQVTKGFNRSHGCVGVAESAAMSFFRSGSLSYYDFEDDSGVRNLTGLRPACHASKTGALGLLLVGDGQGAAHKDFFGGCDCRYNFLGALALAPAQRQRNEDWAVFSDPVPKLTAGPVRHANMNFGALGDRRHTDKKLWLSVPRPTTAGVRYGGFLSMQLPYLAQFYAEPQVYQRNGDRLAIAGTDQPWVYTSGYRGLKSLTLGLDYYERGQQYVALACATGPKIDGELTDACWDAAGKLFLIPMGDGKRTSYGQQMPKPVESASLRHDKDNLYVAYRQRRNIPGFESRGPWKVETKGRDAEVWNDDCLELLLRGADENMVHLGVSASGATYDALVKVSTDKKGKKSASAVDVSWNGDWQFAVSVKEDEFIIEVAVPWRALESLGISRKELWALVHEKVNVKYPKRPDVKLVNKRIHLSDRSASPKPYTVWLHFADLENDTSGKCVFNVRLQDKVVLKDFDVVAEAGGGNKAVVKEFKGIMAVNDIKLELVSDAEDMKGATAPIISGMQVLAEQPGPVPPPVLGVMTHNKGSLGFVPMSTIEAMDEKKRNESYWWSPQDEEEMQKRLKRRGQLPEQEKK